MRLLMAVLVLFSAAAATAQDATQQIMLDQQIAVQQAQQMQQQASQQAAQQFNDQVAQAAASTPGEDIGAAKPRFSVKPGSYPSSITVRMKDRTRGTAIYYTTDGWTPTTLSIRYIGPITIASTTMLQAVAVGPNNGYSEITSALYTLPAPTPSNATAATAYSNIPDVETLSRQHHTQVPLVFTTPVTTKNLEIGDKLPIVLAQDLIVGGVLIAPKATPVLATVTQVDHPGLGGAPGVLSFAVRSMTVDGQTILLSGSETKEGQPRVKAVHTLFLAIPFVGVSGVLIHGEDAEIPQGATLTASVTGNLPFQRAK